MYRAGSNRGAKRDEEIPSRDAGGTSKGRSIFG
jgi:hypothetical protein